MEVVLLIELGPGSQATQAALLERVGALALSGQARLSFVGTEAGATGEPGRDVVAIGLRRATAAAGLIERWRGEGVLTDATQTRLLRVQPLWSIEPLALMFPLIPFSGAPSSAPEKGAVLTCRR